MKKIIGITFIAVAAVTASWNFSQTQNDVELSDLALANVEALARNESGPICRTNRDHSAICNVYDSGDVCPCGF